ncbi:hypothetical protein BGX23_007176 [Mortierella sp. AD031]|nr:hypothetical protein BGX23_007176 [Mortierella sp. AD031]
MAKSSPIRKFAIVATTALAVSALLSTSIVVQAVPVPLSPVSTASTDATIAKRGGGQVAYKLAYNHLPRLSAKSHHPLELPSRLLEILLGLLNKGPLLELVRLLGRLHIKSSVRKSALLTTITLVLLTGLQSFTVQAAPTTPEVAPTTPESIAVKNGRVEDAIQTAGNSVDERLVPGLVISPDIITDLARKAREADNAVARINVDTNVVYPVQVEPSTRESIAAKKARIEDAVQATKNAVEEGLVPGQVISSDFDIIDTDLARVVKGADNANIVGPFGRLGDAADGVDAGQTAEGPDNIAGGSAVTQPTIGPGNGAGGSGPGTGQP